jgi:ankyrin repeat protein
MRILKTETDARAMANMRLVNKGLLGRTQAGGDLKRLSNSATAKYAAAKYRKKSPNDEEALSSVARKRDTYAVKGLVSANNVNVRHAEGVTPLQKADADKDSPISLGMTPLHMAAMLGSAETVDALIGANALI